MLCLLLPSGQLRVLSGARMRQNQTQGLIDGREWLTAFAFFGCAFAGARLSRDFGVFGHVYSLNAQLVGDGLNDLRAQGVVRYGLQQRFG